VRDQKIGDLCETRRNNFDFLRFALAACVILAHAKFSREGISHADTNSVSFLGGGRMALNGFFVISGFLIANSWMNSKSALDYLKKRILRIYPALVIALLFCILVVGPLGGANLATYFTDPQTYRFLAPLVLGENQSLPGVFQNLPVPGKVNSPVWSIRFEIVCYLMILGLGILHILKQRSVVLGLFCTVWIVFILQEYRFLEHLNFTIFYFGDIRELPRLVTFFLSGTLVYLYRNEIRHTSLWFMAALAGFLITYKFLPSIGMPIFFTYLLFYIAYQRRLRLENFARYGDFSYGLYLYGWPVQQLLIQHGTRIFVFSGMVNRLLLFSLTFCIALGLGVLSSYLVEKPFLRMKGHKSRKAGNGANIRS
jgi:peptidoglycan/LPS O-acetylase OafA/YrhL